MPEENKTDKKYQWVAEIYVPFRAKDDDQAEKRAEAISKWVGNGLDWGRPKFVSKDAWEWNDDYEEVYEL